AAGPAPAKTLSGYGATCATPEAPATMNSKILSLSAILLWAITAAVGVFVFVRGNTRAADDGRRAVVLSAGVRTLVLSEMRVLLQAVQQITEGVQKGDRRMIEEAATQAGTQHMVEANPELMLRLPLEFKQVGLTVHRSFDDIAVAAREGKPDAEI